jgi:hypothetical protein
VDSQLLDKLQVQCSPWLLYADNMLGPLALPLHSHVEVHFCISQDASTTHEPLMDLVLSSRTVMNVETGCAECGMNVRGVLRSYSERFAPKG